MCQFHSDVNMLDPGIVLPPHPHNKDYIHPSLCMDEHLQASTFPAPIFLQQYYTMCSVPTLISSQIHYFCIYGEGSTGSRMI